MKQFLGGTNTLKEDFHPLRSILEHVRNGDRDEAMWLAFLTIQFGQDVSETIRLFYGRFGEGHWDWRTVAEHPEGIREWMRKNREKLKQLRFGNHRKRRINDPDHPRGTPAVIRSFVEWVKDHGNGSPYEAFRTHVQETPSKKDAFDRLYRELGVLDFGRTAKFDLLCLLGNLGILGVSPGHCYLRGATGPRAGTLLMFTGRKSGKLLPEIEESVEKLRSCLGVRVEAMEDALCNWQKRPRRRGARPRMGFVSITCG